MILDTKFDDTLRKLYPTVVTVRGDIAYDKDENIVEYDKAAVEAESNK
jgi:hypothetical protein